MQQANLGVTSMFVNEGDDGDDVLLLDHVQGLRAVNQHAVQHIQHTCRQTACHKILGLPFHNKLNSTCRTVGHQHHGVNLREK